MGKGSQIRTKGLYLPLSGESNRIGAKIRNIRTYFKTSFIPGAQSTVM